MSPDTIAVCLLAGGRSLRFGADDKLVADLGDKPLGLHAADALAGIVWGQRLAVASGGLAQPLQALGFTVVAPVIDGGMGDNIARGVAAVTGGRAVLIVLADMPFVTVRHIQNLVAAVSRDTDIAVSTCDGTVSPPILFGAAYLDALKTLSGDEGARRIIAAAQAEVLRVAAEAQLLMDVDTPEALAAARRYIAAAGNAPLG